MKRHSMPDPENIIDFKALTTRVAYSKRCLRELVQKGTIPSIRLPGRRKRLFDWPAVVAAIREHSNK